MNQPHSDVCKFKIGDRIKRPKDVYAKKWEYMLGTVVCVYGYDLAWPWMLPMSEYIIENKKSGVWRYPELYSVVWDNGKVGSGYFDYGIELV